MKRGPQVILPKDIGLIMAYAGISKESVCVDAGTGSGWLALSLARVAKHVYSYDIREEFIRIAEANRELLDVDNITFKNKDVTKKIDEKEVDLVTLDFQNSDKALPNAKRALKKGGVVLGYLPNTEQVRIFVMKLNKLKFTDVHAVEMILRDLLVREEGVRPSTKGVWHTGYLVFAKRGA